MHTKTMEGLIGARTNMNMTEVPMRVYKEARRKGDTAVMERAMGYVKEFENHAFQYKDEADEGMKEEAREAREKEKQTREETIEKRREERKEKAEELAAQIREGKDSERKGTKADAASLEISPDGQTRSAYAEPDGRISPDPSAPLSDKPVLYSSVGTAQTDSESNAAAINVLI